MPLDLSKYRDSITTMECTLTSSPHICDLYRDVATAKKQSMVEDIRANLEKYISNKYAANIWETNSRYIVGLQVTVDKSGSTSTRTSLQAANQTSAELNVGNPKHNREVTENDVELQAKNGTGTGKDALFRQSQDGNVAKLKLKGLYNGLPFHSAPVALNFITNSILRTLPGKKEFNLAISNYPLPFTIAQDEMKHNETIQHNIAEEYWSAFYIPFVVTFTTAFLAASFILFPIKERASKSKHLQFVSGVPFPIFWLGHLIFDGLYYLIICILMTITLVVFPISAFSKATTLLKFFLLFIFYGWAIIPMSYLFSFRFSIPSSGYVRMVFFYWTTAFVAAVLAGGCIGADIFYALTKDADFITGVFCHVWTVIFQLLVPGLDLWVGIMALMLNEVALPAARERFGDQGKDIMELNISKYFICLVLNGLVCYLLIFISESGILKTIAENTARKLRKGGAPGWGGMALEDSDVLAESDRVSCNDVGTLFMTDSMVLKDLTKYYGNFLAVDRLCLGVKHGECFGLLGVNGAGKTTTFMMLTGDVPISAGDAFITGKSVTRQKKEVQQVIGYCPQFDAIIPELTGAETIRLFARLRGVRESAINALITVLGNDLLFTEHMQKPCGTYSGGNKRKLSTAIALIGNPAVVFLDEPTAGLDPVARRHLWNAVINVRESGTSVVLTSHSMDECEALCTRLAIMVNGRFRCLGSTQHLKNKFGDGFTIVAQLPPSPVEQPKRTRTSLEIGRRRQSLNAPPEPWEAHLQPLRQFIETNFPDCVLKDMHPCYVHYHIPLNGTTTWSQLFKKMEEAKALYQLEVYSVGQTSLEQVFLGFARGQYNAGP